jgi:hypothetical protein
MTPEGRTPRDEAVGVPRGFLACPVICGLAEPALSKHMCSGPFAADELTTANSPALLAVLLYLQALGLIYPAHELANDGRAEGHR